jgi:hypothetical protein
MIKSEYPIKRVFTVVTILDWRTSEYRERYGQLETELNITIHVVSLIDGVVSVTGEPKLESESTEQIQTVPVLQEISYIGVHEFLSSKTFKPVTSTNANGTKNQSTYLQATGRFGLTSEEDERFSREFEKVGKEMKKHRKGEKTLVIGTGEFMHIPMVIASHMGSDVYFQSTTRSPIYPSDRESYTFKISTCR